jgi:hypothetical protein
MVASTQNRAVLYFPASRIGSRAHGVVLSAQDFAKLPNPGAGKADKTWLLCCQAARRFPVSTTP